MTRLTLLAPLFAAVVLLPVDALAEPEAPTEPTPPATFDWNKPSLAVNLGLIQPLLLGGGNVEVDLRVHGFIVSYSHGWSLDLENSTVVGDMREQHVALHLPYSTGLGVGYGFHSDALRSFFDLRAEAKVHRFETSYASADEKTKTSIADYTTYTLGGGVYWTYLPFAHRTDLLRGLDVSTSFRFWPNVATTLAGDRIDYPNRTTGKTETHQAANIGIANTPMLFNVSVGYAFQ